MTYGCALVPGCSHSSLLEYESRPGKIACCVLLHYCIRRFLYNGCPYIYDVGCDARDADVDDDGDGDENDADDDD